MFVIFFYLFDFDRLFVRIPGDTSGSDPFYARSASLAEARSAIAMLATDEALEVSHEAA